MFGSLLGINPDTHRVIASAENLHLADALDAVQPVLDVQCRIVAKIGDIVALDIRNQIDHHDEIR